MDTSPAKKEKKYYTYEEYLALEEKAEFKSEYHDGEIVPLFREIVDGEVVAMAGGSPDHSKISLSVGAELRAALKGTSCEAYNTDLKIRVVKAGRSFYGDVTVVCGELEYYDEGKNVITNPTLIVEVGSPSTEGYDRFDKFFFYRQTETLKEYVLVSTNKIYVEVFTLQESGKWLLSTYDKLTENVEFESIKVEIPMSEIYDRVSFEKSDL